MILSYPGRVLSKKNSRDTAYNAKSGRLFPGKSAALRSCEDALCLFFRSQWGGKPPLADEVFVAIVYWYSGPKPDAWGFAETVSDALQRARVVVDDRLLVPYGTPAVERIRTQPGKEHLQVRLGADA